jgi:hypothetical protein
VTAAFQGLRRYLTGMRLLKRRADDDGGARPAQRQRSN